MEIWNFELRKSTAVAALYGVLRIGKQAPEIPTDTIMRANRTFELARSS